MQADALPDAQVIAERILQGDEAAFDELVRRYHSRMVRLAQGFVRDRAVAEEVVQDAWLGVLRGLGAFEGRSELKTWIFRIVINRARSRGVREARSVPFSALGPAEEAAVDPERFDDRGMWRTPPVAWNADTPERLLLEDEALRRLDATIAELPENQRLVLMLRDVEGVSAAEVCNLLDLTETNQRVLLHRARSTVHRAVERLAGEAG